MKRALLAAAAAAVGIIVACASSSDDSLPTTTAKSAVSRDLSPTLADDERQMLANGQADFAVALYRAVAKSGTDNVFLSPHSASIALAMAYAGASGTTASEMRTALHLALPDDRVHVGFNYLDLQLSSRGHDATNASPDARPFTLKIANSVWAGKGVGLVPAYLDTIALNYGAGVNLVDFAGSPDGARVAINDWVEDNTATRIKDLLGPGSITSNTKLALVNAIYFNADWKSPFAHASTTQTSFTKLDGSRLSASMMYAQTSVPYAKSNGYQAVSLAYEGNELAMLVIVPDRGTFAAFEGGLTGQKILDIADEVKPTELLLGYPKHHFEGNYDLVPILQSLGMNAAFVAGTADFSGLFTTARPRIDQVKQKTFVDVDEKGTEAAAATVVTFADAGFSPVPPTQLVIDRPFIEAIIDSKTKTLVFLGRIVEPRTK